MLGLFVCVQKGPKLPSLRPIVHPEQTQRELISQALTINAVQALLRRIPDSDSTHFQMEAFSTVQNRFREFPYFNSHPGVNDHHHTEEVVKIQKYSTTYLKPHHH